MVFFLCTSADDGLYLYKISGKYSQRYLSYRADMIFIEKNSKGHNSVKTVDGVTDLSFFSARRLMVVYICTKFHENILDGIKVLERTRF